MMKVLLTGFSGFLGREIKKSLNSSELISLGRTDAEVLCDLSKEIPQIPSVDLVIHCAGKAHYVPRTETERQLFFDVNVEGTIHLLNGLMNSKSLPKYFVFISTVAVYGMHHGNAINEDCPLLANDAYGLSKIEAEKIVSEWCVKYNVRCTILRLPLIAGANPPGNLAAMINGIASGYYFNIGGGRARKSIVLASDVAMVIPQVAVIGGIFNLTDGYHPSFCELAQHISMQLGKSNPRNIPVFVARLLAIAGNFLGSRSPLNKDKLDKITSDLTFSDTAARRSFGWNPTPVLVGFKIK